MTSGTARRVRRTPAVRRQRRDLRAREHGAVVDQHLQADVQLPAHGWGGSQASQFSCQGKYGSPCQAWAYWQNHHNY